MLEFPHALVGVTIVTLIPNPTISLPLALLSHFAFDLYPHWNPHINTEIKKNGHLSHSTLAVLSIDIALVGILLSQLTPILILGGILAILPDLLGIPKFIFRRNYHFLKPLHTFQKRFQWDVPLPWGLISQFLVVIVCLILLSQRTYLPEYQLPPVHLRL